MPSPGLPSGLDPDAGWARLEATDDGRFGKAGGADLGEDRLGAAGRAGHQQPTGGLGVGEEVAAPVREIPGSVTWLPKLAQLRCEAPVTKPSCASASARGKQRERTAFDDEGQTGAAREFQSVAEKAEPGDVGDGVDVRVARQLGPDLVEARRGGDEVGVARGVRAFRLIAAE